MLTTRHLTQPCPNCGYPLDSVASALGDHKPEVGDITVCIDCVTVLTFEPGLILRLTTTEELRALPPAHLFDVARVQAVIREGHRIRRRANWAKN
jgi:hypothetical protein